MDHLAKATSYIIEGKYGGAITEIGNAKGKASNPIIEEYYEEIYPLYVIWLDSIFQGYMSRNDVEQMEAELKNQEADLRKADKTKFESVINKAKEKLKKAMDLMKWYATVESVVDDYDSTSVVQKPSFFVDENGKQIMSDTYPRGKQLYLKSKVVLDQYLTDFQKEGDDEKKEVLGKRVMQCIETLNNIPEGELKKLNKQLKKMDDPEQIKALLKI